MKKLIIIPLLLMAITVSGQQFYNYSQYNRNIIAYNPAFTGIEGFMDINGSWRKQWDGFSEAPEIFTLSAHGRIRSDNRYDRKPPYSLRISNPDAYDVLETDSAWRENSPHAVGGYLVADRHEINSYALFLTYAYHLRLSREWTAAAGVGVGIQNTRLPEFTSLDPNDPVLMAMAEMDGETRFDFNLGLTLYTRRFFVGYSAVQLSQKDLFEYQVENPITGNIDEGALIDIRVHHIFNLGYRMRVSPTIEFYPNAIVRYVDGSPINVDATTKFRFLDKVMIGATWRFDFNELEDENIAVAGMVGFAMDKWNFSYSYDYPLNELTNTSNGSHEITVGLSLYKLYPHPADFLW
ncbi:MAG: PorP/SprF family type IX secretion system membrane protein [Candidatus Cyclobacteriaceae bacterium M2_1C_046]